VLYLLLITFGNVTLYLTIEMKKLIILISAVFVFFSCKENEVSGFDSFSVKKDLTAALNQSEWTATSTDAYYSKIAFDDQIIVLTTNDGSQQRVAFAVTNVPAPMVELPAIFQLRLKSGLFLSEIYISRDYNELRSLSREKQENSKTFDYNYTRTK